MGDVWIANDVRAERQVAAKFIKPFLLEQPGFVQRFLNEARTLGRLEHDRIVTLYNVLEADGHLALILRFIDGRSLADVIDERGALQVEEVLRCARDVLPALGYAHDRGVIHRDIKPENILVDRDGRCFLADFGIAVRQFAERGTLAGSSIGTPHYMSPEQILRPRELSTETGGQRADIYSFGVLLYEMLSGKVPFGDVGEGDEFYIVQNKHCEEPPPPLASVNPNVPPAVGAVVMRCLEKSPDDRPQNCAELLGSLEQAAAGRAPVVPGPRRGGTVVEDLRPHRKPVPHVPPPAEKKGAPKAVWLAATGFVVAAGIAFALLSQWRREPQAEPKEGGATVILKQPETTIERPQPKQPADGVPGGRKIESVERKGRPVEPPKHPVVSPEELQAAEDARRAGTLAAEAESLFQEGEYCTAQARIEEAMRLNPREARYRQRQAVMRSGCTSSLR